jgi:hypothetical protein
MVYKRASEREREYVAAYLVFGGNVGTERQQRGNNLGSSLPGSHMEARGEWILEVVLIERRQLLNQLRQTDVFEVNDLADGLLVVVILVQPVARAAGAVGRHTRRLESTAGHTFGSRICSLFCCRMCSLCGRMYSFILL